MATGTATATGAGTGTGADTGTGTAAVTDVSRLFRTEPLLRWFSVAWAKWHHDLGCIGHCTRHADGQEMALTHPHTNAYA